MGFATTLARRLSGVFSSSSCSIGEGGDLMDRTMLIPLKRFPGRQPATSSMPLDLAASASASRRNKVAPCLLACSLLLAPCGPRSRGAACPCCQGSLGCVARHRGLAPEPIMAQETILSGSLPCGVAADLSLVSFFILQCTCLVPLFDAR